MPDFEPLPFFLEYSACPSIHFIIGRFVTGGFCDCLQLARRNEGLEIPCCVAASLRVSPGVWHPPQSLVGFLTAFLWIPEWLWPGTNVGAIASQSVVLVRAMDLWRPWARSHGSGFVWDADGHIVTNSHVVQMSSLLAVHFADGGACRAQVVATSERCDVALLKLKNSSCSGPSGTAFELPKPLPLSKSSPRLGEEVMAVGHPGNWAWLVGVGSVTGVGRESSRAVQKWLALQDFQRRCAVNGMVFASVPAGPAAVVGR